MHRVGSSFMGRKHRTQKEEKDMDRPKFSLIVRLHETEEKFFRDCLESIASQTYEDWELYVLDHGRGSCERLVAEFFPSDDRVHFRQLKKENALAYALNIGFHFVLTEAARHGIGSGAAARRDAPWYVLIVDQHDRLGDHALQTMSEKIQEYQKRNEGVAPSVVYFDHDELVGVDRMSPHFKPDLNRELLLQQNYIGNSFAVSVDAIRKLGEVQEKLTSAALYDYLLRAVDAELPFLHIPGLLYHKRVMVKTERKKEKKIQQKNCREHMLAAQAFLKKQGIEAEVTAAANFAYWKVHYDGSGAFQFRTQKEYMFLHEKEVRPLTRHSVEKMYGYLRQKDVAVVGVRFLKGSFTVENCGYIFDSQGNTYPAFYDQKLYRSTYEYMGELAREVSMVDFGYCLIDAKIYRKLQGFDTELSGRDLMLDFCIRARENGYRIIVDPSILVRRLSGQADSTESSRMRLLEKHGEQLLQGDPMYNANLPCDLDNYKILSVGQEEGTSMV